MCFEFNLGFNLFLFYYILIYIYISAVKRLIVINRIQNKSFCLHNIWVCTVHIYYANTNTCMNIRKICYVYILNIFI